MSLPTEAAGLSAGLGDSLFAAALTVFFAGAALRSSSAGARNLVSQAGQITSLPGVAFTFLPHSGHSAIEFSLAWRPRAGGWKGRTARSAENKILIDAGQKGHGRNGAGADQQ